jgi:antitoxin component of MazEF toxin-antitoxin module
MPKAAIMEQAQAAPIQSAPPAPYLPFLTFLSALTALEQGVPKKLDRTIWPNQSGLVQSQILMAFRFLRLVDDEDRPTDLLHELVVEKEQNRAPIISKIVGKAYADILAHDLTKMTPKMVEDEMDRYNVSGDTKRKAVTFFLRAVKFAGLPMHPLLSTTVRNTGPRKRKGKRLFVPEMNGAADPMYENAATQQGSIKTVRLSNGGTVTLRISADPFTLPTEDRQFVFELVDKLQAYASANSASGEEEEEEEEEP